MREKNTKQVRKSNLAGNLEVEDDTRASGKESGCAYHLVAARESACDLRFTFRCCHRLPLVKSFDLIYTRTCFGFSMMELYVFYKR